MLRKTINFISCLLCIVAVSVCAEPKYNLVDLGFQESDRSEAISVNDLGQVVGIYWMSGKKHHFIWDKKSGAQLIDLPETAEIVTINNLGQIAGHYTRTINVWRGFVWDTKTGFVDIGTLGGAWSHVSDMNDLGQIVGVSEGNEKGIYQAFIWQQNEMLSLKPLTGDLGLPGYTSFAREINNRGQIIGTSEYPIVHKGKVIRSKPKPVIWQDGEPEEIKGVLDPCDSCSALSISDHGVAVFHSNTIGAFAYDTDTKNILAVPCTDQGAFSITDNNDIYSKPGMVVYYALFNKNEKNIYNPDIQAYEYVEFSQLFGSKKGWKQNSFYCKDFNNNRTVVGKATNIYGEEHAVMLEPVVD